LKGKVEPKATTVQNLFQRICISLSAKANGNCCGKKKCFHPEISFGGSLVEIDIPGNFAIASGGRHD
jgi:hypothetical protein